MRLDLSSAELRVLGCLIEKQRTTPDAYPLSLNSLRLACNQSTNRDPVVDYDEGTVREALGALGRRHWIRSASGRGGRAIKYRHLLEDELPLPGPQMALLAVLMLRGPQTPGELKQRAGRMSPFPDLAAVSAALDDLIEQGLARRLPRRPGQKEERFEHLLGAGAGDEADGPTKELEGPHADPADAPAHTATAGGNGNPASEIAELRATVAALGDRVRRLERELGVGEDAPA